jgi:hypothetical protein
MLATRSNASRARHRRNRDATHAFPGAGGAECASAGGASPICGARRRSRSLSPPERDLWPSGSKVAHERAITQPRILARLRRILRFLHRSTETVVATEGAEANSRRGLATVLGPLAWQLGREQRKTTPSGWNIGSACQHAYVQSLNRMRRATRISYLEVQVQRTLRRLIQPCIHALRPRASNERTGSSS